MENSSGLHTKNINIVFKILLVKRTPLNTQPMNRTVKWVAIDDYLQNVEPFIDNYLNIEDPICCHLQGGFFIDIEGKPWIDGGYVDEFYSTVRWFWALQKLLENNIVNIGVWEESDMVLELKGN